MDLDSVADSLDKPINWQMINAKFYTLLCKNIANAQKKRILLIMSAKNYYKHNVTIDIRNYFLDCLNKRPDQAIINTANNIKQCIYELNEDIKLYENICIYDLFPSYNKARMKTAKAELEAFEYWLGMITNLVVPCL
jgi:hypothetical protein